MNTDQTLVEKAQQDVRAYLARAQRLPTAPPALSPAEQAETNAQMAEVQADYHASLSADHAKTDVPQT